MGLEGLAGKLKFRGEVGSKPGGLGREGGAMAQVCALRTTSPAQLLHARWVC